MEVDLYSNCIASGYDENTTNGEEVMMLPGTLLMDNMQSISVLTEASINDILLWVVYQTVGGTT